MSNLDVNVVDERRQRTGLRGRLTQRRTGRSTPEQHGADRPTKERRPSRSARGPVQMVGSEPRVDLLPSEVHTEQRARATVRRAWLAVVVVAAVVLMGIGIATTEGMRARTDLAQAQSEGTSVLQEQLRYSDVRSVQRDTDLIKAAQAVGGSAQVDWNRVLGAVSGALPAGTSVTGLAVTSMDPVKGFTQSTEPLAPSRVATLEITITSSSVPSVPDLSDGLKAVPGYSDARITTISSSGESGAYTGQITLDLDATAFDKTYDYKAAE